MYSRLQLYGFCLTVSSITASLWEYPYENLEKEATLDSHGLGNSMEFSFLEEYVGQNFIIIGVLS